MPQPLDHPDGPAAPVVLARADSGHGEIALRRRGDVLELVVDGVFAMDTAHTATEVALATLALQRLGARPGPAQARGLRVLVGGLGLGFTTRAVLSDPRVAAVEVVELQPRLVDWVRTGLVPPAAGLLDDARVRVSIGDVGEVVAGRAPGGLDAILLDVDNGPGFLVHEGNAALYRTPFLRAALAALAPGGVLAVWSADPSPDLPGLLREAGGDEVDEVPLDVERDGRRFRYAVYLARRPVSRAN